MMWLLFLILSAPSIPGEKMLDQFATYEACRIEAARVDTEMRKSYPGDTDFRFECRFKEKAL